MLKQTPETSLRSHQANNLLLQQSQKVKKHFRLNEPSDSFDWDFDW